MDLGLAGKRAFVSGASSGIGRAIARELAREGCAIIIHGRDRCRSEETAHLVEAEGVKAVVALGDLAIDSDCDAVGAKALDRFGGIDIVINNAGGALRSDNPGWSALEPKDYLASYQMNFLSTLRMTQYFLPGIKAAGWGRIVNISSGASLSPGLLPDYGAAKAALNKLTIDMAKEVGDYGATANGIFPGVVRTPAVEQFLAGLKEKMMWDGDKGEIERRYVTDYAPQSIKRIGVPEDIAKAVAFLVSDAASYITGVILRVGGGSAIYAGT